MNPKTKILFSLGVLAVSGSALLAEADVVIRKTIKADGPRHVFVARHGDGDAKKEKVAFLGVQTSPVTRTLAAQLGLPADLGLVVNEVVEDSPAAGVLQQHDILTKFEDQLLVDQHQLGVLIRRKKEGDEVAMTIVRGGKESVVKVKLGQREVPVAGMFNLEIPGPEGAGAFKWFGHNAEELARMRELPGMGPGEVNDVVRIIGNASGHFMEGPGVHVFSRSGQGMTILDLPKGNVVYSDDEGSVEVTAEEGKRELKVKDAQGKPTFEGPILTKEDRAKLPPEIRERIDRIEKANVSVEVGQDFRFEGADVRPLPVPSKEKIRFPKPDVRPLPDVHAF